VGQRQSVALYSARSLVNTTDPSDSHCLPRRARDVHVGRRVDGILLGLDPMRLPCRGADCRCAAGERDESEL